MKTANKIFASAGKTILLDAQSAEKLANQLDSNFIKAVDFFKINGKVNISGVIHIHDILREEIV